MEKRDAGQGWGGQMGVVGRAVAGLLAIAVAGCGGADVDGASVVVAPDNTLGPPVSDRDSYFPLTAGARWQYKLLRKGVPASKVQTVDATEALAGAKGGLNAVRIKQEQGGEVQLTWFERTGATVMIHRQQEFDAAGAVKWDEWYLPYDIRLDESTQRMQPGGAWAITYEVHRTSARTPPSTRQKIHQFHVEAMNENVTVAAGTFQTVRVRRSDPTDGSYRQYWYARGVGKVREVEGNGDSEELSSYSGL